MELHLTRAMRRGARREKVWEADIVPIPAAFDDHPNGRPGLFLITAGGRVVASDLLACPPREIPELAALVGRGIEEAASQIGGMPQVIRVRDAELAVGLDGYFAGRKLRVSFDGPLMGLDEALAGLLARLGVSEVRLLTASPERWGGWEMDDAEIRALFSAAAALYRADPWARRSEWEPLELDSPDDGFWYVSFSGSRGDLPAVTVFRDLDDLATSLTRPIDEMATELVDRHFVLVYSPRDSLPDPMIREVVAQTWPVAAPDAYPRLMTVNTPGGGISRADAANLVEILKATAAYTEAGDPPPDTQGPPVPGEEDQGIPFLPGWSAPDSPWMVRDASELISDLVESMHPVGVHEWVEGHNATPDPELGGLSPDQVSSLLYQDWDESPDPLDFAADLSLEELSEAEIFHNARLLLRVCNEGKGAGATAKGNLNRATVARMWREGSWDTLGIWDIPDTDAEGQISRALNEEGFLGLQWIRILLELGGLIERRGSTFRITVAGSDLLAPDRAGKLFRHLFVTQMRKMNLAFGDWHPTEGSLQFGLPYTLVRLDMEAREWASLEGLLPRILLPKVLEDVYEDVGRGGLPGVVSHRVFRPLHRFGLLEWIRRDDRPLGHEVAQVRVRPLFHRFIRTRW